jgi:two-component system chemotaxis response regulator CheY
VSASSLSLPVPVKRRESMGKRILIADDSSMMRRMVSDVLEAQGHQIAGSAKNGSEAVALYMSLKPDVVIMDITMRGMDGITAAKEILHYDPEAQIILLSNLNDVKYREDALRLGVKGFVNKNEPVKIFRFIDNS